MSKLAKPKKRTRPDYDRALIGLTGQPLDDADLLAVRAQAMRAAQRAGRARLLELKANPDRPGIAL